ncbi:CocE/NonD family hydrolase [Polaribacter vadi]|uniref:CocE/NonD family hydrolase n=1 Tax=Polaribacter TaxID=52959 RepID=UPI001C0A501D|nr:MULTISPECIES: CocE/NonD family hydrolase [Polaribacter]MBU3010705.1 CocE/NonD family hydrolase [Polaribacter vadi]MDO6740516.1 CocE/NonD family hydrolase [Polaribacter sp. 1_MG-2023]
MKKSFLLLLLLVISISSYTQELPFKKVEISDSVGLADQMQHLAKLCDVKNMSELDLFKFQLIRGNYKDALVTFQKRIKETPIDQRQYLDIYLHYVEAKLSKNFNVAFKKSYRKYVKSSDDIQVINLDKALIIRDPTDYYVSNFKNTYQNIKSEKISQSTAKDLVKKYFLSTVFSSTRELYFDEIKQDHKRRYTINDSIVIPMKDGSEVSIVVVKRKGKTTTKKSAILVSSIYAGTNEVSAMLSASKGYIGIIANTRGKRLSKSEIKPLEYEHTDVYEVIDWISKQSWSNQKVAMFGGSYNGFAQWASMKHKVHPALKTIVPMVAIAPGIDYPMENNVLHNYSYSWNFYVTNNKFLDFGASNDFNRWNSLKNKWYKTGVAFNKLDSLDGQVNTLWNRYMAHPSYDDFWKKMIPYKQEFAKIDIPILTITGYYDDSQRGAMYYYNEHYKYAKNPNHYLLVGPYDHWTAQSKPEENLRNYKLDKAALINIEEDLLYQWFDYILKEKTKPNILKDKVNFQVMNTNTWMHKPTLSAMTNDTLTFHLSSDKQNDFYALKSKENNSEISMSVDFKDRKSMTNTDYYPWPLEREQINIKDGLIFKSETLTEDVIINGSFLGNLELIINKKDVDYSVTVYQLTPENKYFHLSYYIGRASYAKDREHRNLLTPNQKAQISFNNSKLISKKIEKGSKIVVVVNVNKNNNAQINYGTGKDVNTESIKYAKKPLQITFTGNSSISFPIWNSKMN